MTDRPTVVFVGAFAQDPKAVVRGGQVAACRRLLESPLAAKVDFRLIDSTMRSLPPPPVFVRGRDALMRVARFFEQTGDKPEAALVFTSFSTTSLAEKNLMCALSRLRSVRTVLCIRSEVRPLAAPWSGLIRASFRMVDRFVCQSEHAGHELTRLYGVDPERIVIIPNWMDPNPYLALGRNRTSAGTHLLYVGWLEPWKGAGDALSAVLQLVEEGKEVRLTICGDGSMRKALEERARKLGGRVEFLGWVKGERLLDAYDRADVFLLPSHTEGMPNALLEAMAAGLPVVASAVGGVPEVMTDGENGFLVPSGDPPALARAIERLLANPGLRQEMAAKNRARIQKNHDIARAWPKLLAILRPFSNDRSAEIGTV
jgi:glycosyltransferase involved in cell wall biosynthesis